MCYNISLTPKSDFIENRFNAQFEQPGLFQPIYHNSAFSTPVHPVITTENHSLIQLFQWGLIPFWVKDMYAAGKIRLRTLNARAETIFEKPAFRLSIRAKRCLVLVDGFYEWREVGKRKYPYYIRLVDHNAFALAGIWDTWVDGSSGLSRDTFSIITTRANALMELIHNTRKRMPVILRHEDEKIWLNQDLDREAIKALLNPYDEKEMEGYTVSKLISSRKANTNVPEVIEKYRYEELEN